MQVRILHWQPALAGLVVAIIMIPLSSLVSRRVQVSGFLFLSMIDA